MNERMRWDERCPVCEQDIGADIYPEFESSDYSIEFSMLCPCCESEIEVEVRTAPEFGLRKKEANQ